MAVDDRPVELFLQHVMQVADAFPTRCLECGNKLLVIHGSSTPLPLPVAEALVDTWENTCSRQHVVVLSWRRAASNDDGPPLKASFAGRAVAVYDWLLPTVKAGKRISFSLAKTTFSWDHGLRTLRRLIWLVPVTIYWLRWLLGVENER